MKNENLLKYAVINAEKSEKIKNGRRVYMYARIFYIIGFVCTIVVNAAYIMGELLSMEDSGAEGVGSAVYTVSRNNALTTGIVTLFLIVAFVVVIKKLYLVFLCINLTGSIVLMAGFMGAMSENTTHNDAASLMYRHGIWISLLMVASLIMYLQKFIEKKAVDSEYERIEERIYTDCISRNGRPNEVDINKAFNDFCGEVPKPVSVRTNYQINDKEKSSKKHEKK